MQLLYTQAVEVVRCLGPRRVIPSVDHRVRAIVIVDGAVNLARSCCYIEENVARLGQRLHDIDGAVPLWPPVAEPCALALLIRIWNLNVAGTGEGRVRRDHALLQGGRGGYHLECRAG